MHECKDCDHLMVCKYTDAGDGKCQKPKYFRDKHQLQAVVNISPNTRKIDGMAAELEATKALLTQAVADLKEADIDCLKCVHKAPAAPCNSDENEVWCDDCPHDCYCKDCCNNSKWEYQKFKEANQ